MARRSSRAFIPSDPALTLDELIICTRTERSSMTATYPAALTGPVPGTGLAGQPVSRAPLPRTYLMCRPEHFTVRYAINPWMASGEPVDTVRASRQWQGLLDAYTSLG